MQTETRLKLISSCTDVLALIRAHYGMSDEELAKDGYYKWGIDLGECDVLEELHRLIWDYDND